ncbi:hypothetical protein KIPE111705_35320 [Kibdelosporangium persicum]
MILRSSRCSAAAEDATARISSMVGGTLRSLTANRSSSATVVAAKAGRCGTHATIRRHAARSEAPTTIEPEAGETNPSSAAMAVDFPPPLGCESRTISPGRNDNDSPSGAKPSRRATRRSETSATTSPENRKPAGVSPDSACTRRIASIPSSLAWWAAPAARSGK